MTTWRYSNGTPQDKVNGQSVYYDPATYQIGGKTLSQILGADDYATLTKSLTDAHNYTGSVLDERNGILGNGASRLDEYGQIKDLPDYQSLASAGSTAKSLLDKALQTNRFNSGDLTRQAYSGLLGDDPAGVPYSNTSFLSKIGAPLANTIKNNPWVVALPFAAAAAPALLGASAVGDIGAAGEAAASGGAATGGAAAAGTGASAAAAGGIGSTLSSYGSKLLNLPSSVGSSVTGATNSQALGDAAAGAVKGAAVGGGSSALTGQNIGKGILGGALTGGLVGGAGSALSSLGNATGITGEGSLLGTTNGTPLSGGLQGPTTGSGILGGATGGTGSGFGSLLSKGLGVMAGGGTSGYGSSIGTLLGGANSYFANQKAQKDLINAQNNALSQLQPYQASGGAANTKLSDLLGTSGNAGASGYGSLTSAFNPTDLASDPGYQFNLNQGNQALDRQQAAKGGYFSGAALKAAQDYGQGLADSTYNQAFNRDAATKQQTYSELAGQAGVGANAANEAGNIYQNIGNAKASAGVGASNIFNSTLSSLLNGGNNNNALLSALLSKYS